MFACVLNVFVWFVCDILCGVVWSVCVGLLCVCFLCVCVFCCSSVRLNGLPVMYDVLLYMLVSVVLLLLRLCVFCE